MRVFDYRYNKTGQRTRLVEGDGSVTTWAYDQVYQVTRHYCTSTQPGASLNITLSYDGGNPTVEVMSRRQPTLPAVSLQQGFGEHVRQPEGRSRAAERSCRWMPLAIRWIRQNRAAPIGRQEYRGWCDSTADSGQAWWIPPFLWLFRDSI
jgi:hypothetical protein